MKECPFPSKCRECGSEAKFKHLFGIHELYKQRKEEALGSATKKADSVDGVKDHRPATSDGQGKATVRHVKVADERVVLLRISAVRLINSKNGKETLAYAQHDIGSQATLISQKVKDELGLATSTESVVTLHTLSGQVTPKLGQVDLQLQSLHSGEIFPLVGANVVPNWADDKRILPHALDVSSLKHFGDASIQVLPGKDRVDLLIGQDNARLMTVIEEREGSSADHPNCVLTRLGYVASGGRLAATSTAKQVSKVVLQTPVTISSKLEALRQENEELKAELRERTLDEEKFDLSQNDIIARQMVEPNIKVCDNRYEIPVPLLKQACELKDNYEMAAKRAFSTRQTALKKPQLLDTLVTSMVQLQENDYITPVDRSELASDCPKWYLHIS